MKTAFHFTSRRQGLRIAGNILSLARVSAWSLVVGTGRDATEGDYLATQ